MVLAKRILLVLMWLGVAACAPGVKIKAPHAAAPVGPDAPFLVIKDVMDVQGEELGDIRIKDTGFTLICDYDKVVALAVSRARGLGANALWIYEHRPPTMRSTCHQIRAKAMRLVDLTPYEKEIVWSPTRPLRQVDFKASIQNRPFQAATSSNVRYRYNGKLFGPVTVTIESYFDCFDSYFKPSPYNDFTLAHEQLHFDITELIARRFAQKLQEEVGTVSEFQQKHEAIFRQISTDWRTLQDEYDSEVYATPAKLPQWQQRIARELASLQPYASKSFQITR